MNPLTGIFDLDLEILKLMDDRTVLDFCRASQTNRYGKRLCDVERLWQARVERQYPNSVAFKSSDRTWKNWFATLTYYDSKWFRNQEKFQDAINRADFDMISYLETYHVQYSSIDWTVAAEKGRIDVIQMFLLSQRQAGEALIAALITDNQKLADYLVTRYEIDDYRDKQFIAKVIKGDLSVFSDENRNRSDDDQNSVLIYNRLRPDAIQLAIKYGHNEMAKKMIMTPSYLMELAYIGQAGESNNTEMTDWIFQIERATDQMVREAAEGFAKAGNMVRVKEFLDRYPESFTQYHIDEVGRKAVSSENMELVKYLISRGAVKGTLMNYAEVRLGRKDLYEQLDRL